MSSIFFSQRLKNLRNANNIKQKDLAALLAVTVRTIVNYENGAREPDIAGLISIAESFCVSLDYLMGRSDDTRQEEYIDKEEESLRDLGLLPLGYEESKYNLPMETRVATVFYMRKFLKEMPAHREKTEKALYHRNSVFDSFLNKLKSIYPKVYEVDPEERERLNRLFWHIDLEDEKKAEPKPSNNDNSKD